MKNNFKNKNRRNSESKNRFSDKNDKYGKKNAPKGKSSSDSKTFKCEYMDNEGRGVVSFGTKKLAVGNLIKGETARLNIKRGRDQFFASVDRIEKKSPHRTDVKCKHFHTCGGCQLQHMSYEGQLQYKQDTVERLMKPYGKVNKIISMDNPYDYRNKIHATYGTARGNEIISGFYEESSHRLLPVERCIIQDPKADAINATIRTLLKSFKLGTYDERSGRGFLRHTLIKTGFSTGEVMVVLVTGTKVFPSKKNFVKALLDKHPEITTVVMNINNKRTSMILGDRETVLYGKGTIKDTLCGCTFNISPKSFYQINPIQTEKLYNAAIEMAGFKGRETVLDAYSGIGTIGMILSRKVKKVIAVELNRDAVDDAIINAKMNNIRNVRFYTGDAGEFMLNMASEGKSLDTVIMDPPRSGSDENFLSSVVKIKPKSIVYVSCNPVTQARDLEYLVKRGYKVDEIQPVDMFPNTFHVENIVKLSLK